MSSSNENGGEEGERGKKGRPPSRKKRGASMSRVQESCRSIYERNTSTQIFSRCVIAGWLGLASRLDEGDQRKKD
jgi:hypothetical protein